MLRIERQLNLRAIGQLSYNVIERMGGCGDSPFLGNFSFNFLAHLDLKIGCREG